jgi:hypothetical protein
MQSHIPIHILTHLYASTANERTLSRLLPMLNFPSFFLCAAGIPNMNMYDDDDDDVGDDDGDGYVICKRAIWEME